MLTCTDACCAINLMNGGVLEVIASLPSTKLCVQGLVEDELGKGFEKILQLANAGKFELVSGDLILASEVGQVSNKYNIGLGESECILIGRKLDCSIASDDRKARSAAVKELGRSRVTGTLGLLQQAVSADLLSAKSALESYHQMTGMGAFLPVVDESFFEKISASS